MTKVIAQASKVPVGMARLGFLRSPEMLAPAKMEKTIIIIIIITSSDDIQPSTLLSG